MKKEMLEKLNGGGLGLESVFPFVLARVIKIIFLGLLLSITFWLFWQGHFSIGAFASGSIGGFLVFRIWNFLKTQFSKSDH